jgi:poly(hydroxyalkanoate) granule-associated protein
MPQRGIVFEPTTNGRPPAGRYAEEFPLMQTEELSSKIRKFPAEVLDSARKVWLAGLGAVALAEEEGVRLFGELVDRGRTIEGEGRKQLAKARLRAETQIEEAQSTLDQQVARLVERLGMPHRRQIEALAERVEGLSRAVQAVELAEGPQPVPSVQDEPAQLEPAPLEPVTVEWAVLHLLPQGEGWRIEAEGAKAPLSTHGTKAEALAAGREAAGKRMPSKLVVHRLDDTVQTTYAYE